VKLIQPNVKSTARPLNGFKLKLAFTFANKVIILKTYMIGYCA